MVKLFRKKQKRIYLDYVSSTPVDERVLEEMKPYWNEKFGNPLAKHSFSREAKRAVENSRKKIADIFRAQQNEIIFTSNGTESNNLAILGFINYIKKEAGTLDGYHAITTEIEHSSILKVFKHLEEEGLEVSYLKANKNGIVSLDDIKKTLKENTILISIMYVNNEIGTIQPIKDITKVLRTFKKTNKERILFPNLDFPIFHTDASQAGLFLDLNIDKLGVDLMTVDGQKIYGPKGIGALYIRNGIKIKPLMFGGAQEKGIRPGTENVPLIVGLGKALEYAQNEREEVSENILRLREYFINRVLNKIKGSILNGDRKNRIPNNVNFSFEGVNHEFLATQLDAKGIAVSTKSACLSNKEDDSYVIKALSSKATKLGGGAIRFSLGKETTKKDINFVIKTLKGLLFKE